MLDSQEAINDNRSASFGFERPVYAVNGGNAKARINEGSVFRKAKVVPANSRLAGQFNRAFFNSGFFAPIDAVLQTKLSTVVGGVEQSDVMQSCESRGRGAKSQIAPDERSKKGYMRSYRIAQKGSSRF